MAKTAYTKSCTQCFSLLGDSTRLKIFTKVRAGIDQVKLLEKEISVSQPTISHHLKILTEYGLIKAAKHGRETTYKYQSQFACAGCNVFNSKFISPSEAAQNSALSIQN